MYETHKRSAIQIVMTGLLLFLLGCGGTGSGAGGGGGGGTSNITFFAYVTNGGANNTSALLGDGTTGKLSTVTNSPFTVELNPSAAVADPAGKTLYVTNFSASTVSVLTINAATGGLTPAQFAAFGSGGGAPISIAMEPTGRFLYVANEVSITVHGLKVDPLNVLVPNNGVLVANIPLYVVVDRSGKYLYVPTNAGNIAGFSIDAGTGLLTQLSSSPFPAGAGLIAAATSPTGDFLYVVEQGGVNKIFGYTINPADGSLTAMSNSPFPTGGMDPASVTLDPAGRFLFVSNKTSNSISVYSVNNSTGIPTAVSSSPFPSGGTGPVSITTDPSGTFALTANNGSNNVSVLKIAVSGSLGQVSGSPFQVGSGPTSVITVTK